MLTWLKKRFEGLGTAFRDVWFYVLFGAALGLGLVYFSRFYIHNKTLEIVVEHLGVGLIVSSFAVLLFEWRSEAQRTMRLAERLVEVSRAEGKEGLPKILNTLVGSRDDLPEAARDIEKTCTEMILLIHALLEKKTRVSDQYVGFIASLQRRLISKNLEAFVSLSEGQTAEISVPRTAGELAEDILTAQIQALGGGDRYDVVSDLRTWIGRQLDDFQKETERAIREKGVRVRRIFNLAHASLDYISAGQYNEIVSLHRESMKRMVALDAASPAYEVRWIDESTMGDHGAAGSRLHFGLIALRDGKGLMFDFAETDLSRIIISPNPYTFSKHQETFEALWKNARELADLPTFSELVVDRG